MNEMESRPGHNRDYIRSRLWDIAALLALLAAFLGTWIYMDSHGLVLHQAFSSRQSREGLEVSPCQGTLLAKKSNSLDGVPFYTEAGGAEQGGLFPEGKCIQVTECAVIDGRKWLHTAYCGLEGWLEESFTRPISDDALYIQAGSKIYVNALAEKGISGYAEPDMTSRTVRDGLVYGEEFIVEELSGGWGKVTDRGETFWIDMYFAGSYPSEYWKVESLRSSQGINLREDPDEDSRSLGKVPEKEAVRVLEFKKGWGRVDYEGQTGWLNLNYCCPDKVPADG